MTLIEIKQKLLSLNIFEDNQYLNCYCELILNNLNNKKQKYKTQIHHIIPRAYYKQNNLEIDNSKNNLINLLYVDHVIAHCYLSLSSKDSKFKHAMMVAIYKMMGSKFVDNKEVLNDFILNSDIYQKAYENSRVEAIKFNPMNIKDIRLKHDSKMQDPNIRSKLSKGMSLSRKLSDKKIHIYKDRQSKRVSEKELNNYLLEGWLKGNPKGMIYIHKENIDKKCWPEDLGNYLKQGWLKGRYTELKIKEEDSSTKLVTEKIVKRFSGMAGKKKPEGFNKSDSFRKAQSERLNNFYKSNPKWKTKAKKQVRLFNEEFKKEIIFDSVKEAEKFLGINYKHIGKGFLKESFKLGYVNLKNCIYYKWNIEKIK